MNINISDTNLMEIFKVKMRIRFSFETGDIINFNKPTILIEYSFENS